MARGGPGSLTPAGCPRDCYGSACLRGLHLLPASQAGRGSQVTPDRSQTKPPTATLPSRLLTHSFISSIIHSLTHPSFTHSFLIHSFTQWASGALQSDKPEFEFRDLPSAPPACTTYVTQPRYLPVLDFTFLIQEMGFIINSSYCRRLLKDHMRYYKQSTQHSDWHIVRVP